MTDEMRAGQNWPPAEGQLISFKSGDGWKTGILSEVRWGLVWRDFILEDGRVIPEVKVSGCPQPAIWRETSEISPAEREAWEERLASMAERIAGVPSELLQINKRSVHRAMEIMGIRTGLRAGSELQGLASKLPAVQALLAGDAVASVKQAAAQ